MKKLNKIKNWWTKRKNKLIVNIRWEQRLKNLSKKYEKVLEENEKLRKALNKDKNLKEIEYLKSYITILKRQRDNLRMMHK